MASRSPPLSKRGQREDDDEESCRRKKLEKGKEPVTKDADEEPFFDETEFTMDLLRSAFRQLEDVGAAFDIKVHHDVYKDLSVEGLAFRIHGLAEKLENLPVVKRAAHLLFVFDDDSSDGDDSSYDGDDGIHGRSDGSHGGGDGSHSRDRLNDRLLLGRTAYVVCVCVCLFVFVRLLNCLVCFKIMNC
jgi:hypothetical protein